MDLENTQRERKSEKGRTTVDCEQQAIAVAVAVAIQQNIFLMYPFLTEWFYNLRSTIVNIYINDTSSLSFSHLLLEINVSDRSRWYWLNIHFVYFIIIMAMQSDTLTHTFLRLGNSINFSSFRLMQLILFLVGLWKLFRFAFWCLLNYLVVARVLQLKSLSQSRHLSSSIQITSVFIASFFSFFSFIWLRVSWVFLAISKYRLI